MKQKRPGDHKKWLEREEGRFPMYALVAAIAASLAYVGYHLAWRRAGFGGPDQWGAFGDYFAGLVNPVISFLTLILLLFTLRETRKIGADTAKMMDDQRAALAEQKTDMDEQLRLLRDEAEERAGAARVQTYRTILQGLLEAWKDEMANRVYNGVVTVEGRADFPMVQNRSFGDLLYNPLMAERAKWSQSLDEEGRRSYTLMQEKWRFSFAEPIRMIHELDSYLGMFRDAGGSKPEADFYRWRFVPAVRVFANANILDHELAERFRLD